MDATRASAPTTTAGTTPNTAVPEPHLVGSAMTASHTHSPALARLWPRSPGTMAHTL